MLIISQRPKHWAPQREGPTLAYGYTHTHIRTQRHKSFLFVSHTDTQARKSAHSWKRPVPNDRWMGSNWCTSGMLLPTGLFWPLCIVTLSPAEIRKAACCFAFHLRVLTSVWGKRAMIRNDSLSFRSDQYSSARITSFLHIFINLIQFLSPVH